VSREHPNRCALTLDHAGQRPTIDLANTPLLAKYIVDNPFAPTIDAHLRAELEAVRDADAFIFVVDVRRFRAEASLQTLEVLRRHLAAFGRELDTIPCMFQANTHNMSAEAAQGVFKQWGPTVGFSVVPSEEHSRLPMNWVSEHFSSGCCSYTESDADRDVGTVEAVTELIRLISVKQRST
jgi:hypothetical protein